MESPVADSEGEPTRRTTSWRARLPVAGQAVFAVCLLAAAVLVVSAFVLVGQVNEDNALVVLVDNLAGHLDLGVFDVDNGVVAFDGPRADLKIALVNRGLAALVWVLAGRTVARVLGGLDRSAAATIPSVR